jgi:predicted transcriptional regulator
MHVSVRANIYRLETVRLNGSTGDSVVHLFRWYKRQSNVDDIPSSNIMHLDDNGGSSSMLDMKRPRFDNAILGDTAAHSTTSISRGMIFSIPSSDDDCDDEDEIATLRATPCDQFRTGDANGEPNQEKNLNDSLGVAQSSPWSPLTASPYTQLSEVNKSSVKNKPQVVLTIPNDHDVGSSAHSPPVCDASIGATNEYRPSLNLSKVRQPQPKAVLPVNTADLCDTKEKEFDNINRKSNKKKATDTNMNQMHELSRPQTVSMTTTAIDTTICTIAATSKSVLEVASEMIHQPKESKKATKRKSRPSELTNRDNNVDNGNKSIGENLEMDKKGPLIVEQNDVKGGNDKGPVKTNRKGKDQISKKKQSVETKKIEINKENEAESLITEENSTKNSVERSISDKKGNASTSKSVKKEKGATNTKSQKKLTFQEQVMVHMLNALKPFTLKLLSDELKTSETSVNFVLLSLVDKGLVIQKDFASSKGRVKTLYWANHNAKAKEAQVCSLDESLASKEEREQAHRRMIELRNEITTIRNHHQQVVQTPSNDDLTKLLIQEENHLQELIHRQAEIRQRIMASKSSTVVSHKMKANSNVHKTSTNRCPVQLKRRINNLRDEWKSRKMKCLEFIEQLADGLEKKPKDVLCLLDIDTDEMNHVTLPAKYPVP